MAAASPKPVSSTGIASNRSTQTPLTSINVADEDIVSGVTGVPVGASLGCATASLTPYVGAKSNAMPIAQARRWATQAETVAALWPCSFTSVTAGNDRVVGVRRRCGGQRRQPAVGALKRGDKRLREEHVANVDFHIVEPRLSHRALQAPRHRSNPAATTHEPQRQQSTDVPGRVGH